MTQSTLIIRQNQILNQNISFITDLLDGSPVLSIVDSYGFILQQFLIKQPAPKLKLLLRNLNGSKPTTQEIEDIIVQNQLDDDTLYETTLSGGTKIKNITYFYRFMGYSISELYNKQISLTEITKKIGILSFHIDLVGAIHKTIGKNCADLFVDGIMKEIILWGQKNNLMIAHRYGAKGVIFVEDKEGEIDNQTFIKLQKSLNLQLENIQKEYANKLEKALVGVIIKKEDLAALNNLIKNQKVVNLSYGGSNLYSALSNLAVNPSSTRNKTYFETARVISLVTLFLCDALMLGDRIKKQETAIIDEAYKVLDAEFVNLADSLPKFIVDRKSGIDYINYVLRYCQFASDQLDLAMPDSFGLIDHLKFHKNSALAKVNQVLDKLGSLRV